MFKKIGQQLIQGAKAEINQSAGIDLDDLLRIIGGIAEAGLFALAFYFGSKGSGSRVRTDTPVVIVNNYISKGV